MSEKLNHHNDPTGLLQSLKRFAGSDTYLGDPSSVQRLLRHFIGQVVERYDEVGLGVLTPSEAAAADRGDCLRLAGVFLGQDKSWVVVEGWNGKPLADHLRQCMARDLQPDPDDKQIVAQALAVLVHSVYDALREASGGADQDAVNASVAASIRSLSFALVGVQGNG